MLHLEDLCISILMCYGEGSLVSLHMTDALMVLRTTVATPEHVEEAFRLFNVSTVDAARSGINEHLNLSPEIANEIKVNICRPKLKFSSWTLHFLNSFLFFNSKRRHK